MGGQAKRKVGRPTSTHDRKNLVLAATDEEYQYIIRWIRDTRERTVILLRVAREKEEVEQDTIEQVT